MGNFIFPHVWLLKVIKYELQKILEFYSGDKLQITKLC